MNKYSPRCRRIIRLTMLTVMLLLSACRTVQEAPETNRLSSTGATSSPSATEGTAVHATTPVAQQGYVVHARNPRVEPGKSYPFQLFTHCGADYAVDFDGSFWKLARSAQIPAALDDPSQDGTMTLVNANQARFDFNGGTINFIRDTDVKIVPGCD